MIRRPIHLSVLLAAISLTATFRVVFQDRIKQERQQIQTEGKNRRIHELVERWNRLIYSNPDQGIPIEGVLKKIRWNDLRLTEIQQQRLRQSLADVFNFLHAPQFEEYYRLKTEDLPVSFEKSGAIREASSKADLTPKEWT